MVRTAKFLPVVPIQQPIFGKKVLNYGPTLAVANPDRDRTVNLIGIWYVLQ